MTGKFTVSGTNTTIAFSYVGPTAKVQEVVTATAHRIFGSSMVADPAAFDALTNQQKLDLIDVWVKAQVLSMANEYKYQKAQQDTAEALTKYDLP